MALAPGKIDSYNIAPGQSQGDLDLQRKMALQLMQQGMDTSPVQHWTQGLARMLQGGMGGYDLYQQDQKEQADKAESRKLISMLSGGAPAPSGVAAAPASAVSTPATEPSPPPDATAPRGFRNFNPGNIEDGPFAQSLPGYAGSDGRFAKFASMEGGLGAADKLLEAYGRKHGIDTVAGVINRWAPPTADGNPTSAYAETVARQVGISPDTKIDLSDPAMRQKVIAAVAQFENGRPLPSAATTSPPVMDAGGAAKPDAQGVYGADAVLTPQPAAPPRVQLAQAGGGLPPPDSAGVPAAAPTAPAAAPANPMRGGMPADRRMGLINGLMQTRSGAAIGQHLFGAELTKEQNQSRPLTDPRERARFGIQATDTNPYQVDSQGKVTAINPQPFSVNVNQQGQSEFEKEYGKGKAGDALTLERSADKTLQERQQLQVFKSLVQDFKTGKLAPTQSTIGAWGDAIGLAPETLAKLGVPPNAGVNGQLIESLSNQLTLGMIGTKGGEGGGMPANNFSDADRKFLQNTVPGLARMQGGNLVLTEIKQRGLDRNLEKVAMWDDYRSQGKDYAAFERDWRQKVRNSPSIFADIPDMVKQLSAGPQPSVPGAPGAPASSASAPSAEPVAVASPYEARKLPSGTRIKLPDGSTGVVP